MPRSHNLVLQRSRKPWPLVFPVQIRVAASQYVFIFRTPVAHMDPESIDMILQSAIQWETIGRGAGMALVGAVSVATLSYVGTQFQRAGEWLTNRDTQYDSFIESDCPEPCLKNLYHFKQRYHQLLK